MHTGSDELSKTLSRTRGRGLVALFESGVVAVSEPEVLLAVLDIFVRNNPLLSHDAAFITA